VIGNPENLKIKEILMPEAQKNLPQYHQSLRIQFYKDKEENRESKNTRPTIANKRKWNTYNRDNAYGHTDIDYEMHK